MNTSDAWISEEGANSRDDGLPVGVFRLNLNGEYIFCNTRCFELTGVAWEHIQDRPWWYILGAAENHVTVQNWKIACLRAETFSCEFLIERKTAAPVWLWCQISPQYDPAHRSVTGYAGSLTDISAQKASQEVLRLDRERLSFALDAVNDAIWDYKMDADGHAQLYWSDTFYAMLGYAPGEIETSLKAWQQLLHPDDHDMAMARFKDCVESKCNTYRVEERFKKKDGSWLWVLSRGKVITRHADGSLARMTGTYKDISLRKAQEETFEIYQAMAVNSTLATIVCKPDTLEVLYANPAAYQLYGYDLASAEFIGVRGTQFWLEQDLGKLEELLPLALTVGAHSHLHQRRKDGSVFYASASAFPLKDKQDATVGLTVMVRDISREQEDRNLFDRLYHLSTNLTRSLSFEDSLECCLDTVMDVPGMDGSGIYYFSDKTESLDLVAGRNLDETFLSKFSHFSSESIQYQWTIRGEAIFGQISDMGIPHPPDAHLTSFASIAIIPVHFEGRVIATLNIFSYSITAFAPSLRSFLESVSQQIGNVVARFNVENALRESEERLRALINATPDIVCFKDGAGRWLEANRAYLQLFEIQHINYRGKTDLELANESLFYHPVFIANVEADESAWRAHSLSISEESIPKPDGSARTFEIIKVPLWNEDGSRNGLVVLGRDITDRKQVEEEIRRLNVELERRVKERTAQLEASNREIESFSYSISHDLRTPLRSLNGYSQILNEDYGYLLDAQGRLYLKRIHAASRRLAQLIDDLLTLTRLVRAEMIFKTVNLSDVVYLIISELKNRQPDRNVDFLVAPGMMVMGDRVLLSKMMASLLENAWKFTSTCAEATIEVGVKLENEKPIYFVRDNGVGFDMQYINKLFLPFERLHTSPDFEGTGVGLAIVNRIITRHGGHVWAESQIGQGAVFYFTLPMEEA